MLVMSLFLVFLFLFIWFLYFMNSGEKSETSLDDLRKAISKVSREDLQVLSKIINQELDKR